MDYMDLTGWDYSELGWDKVVGFLAYRMSW